MATKKKQPQSVFGGWTPASVQAFQDKGLNVTGMKVYQPPQGGMSGFSTTVAPPPFYGDLAQNDAAALNNLNNTNASLDYQTGQVKQEFGFEDTSNPFSRARLLERTYKQAQARNTNSYAAAGQLYSGALGRAQKTAKFSYDANYDATKRQYENLLNQIQARGTQANTDYQNTVNQDAQQVLLRALGQQG